MRSRGLVAGLLLALGASHAFAHAHLVKATPAAGGTVAASPGAVTLQFSEGLVARLCDITVRDAGGRSVAGGHDGSGKSLSVTLPAKLAPGVYSVTWRAVSVDSHRTQGRFSFTIAP